WRRAGTGPPEAGSYGRARAEAIQHAVSAARPPGDADGSTVLDQCMREPRPVIPWHDRHQLLLDLHRIVLLGQLEQPGESLDMGVDHHPFIFPEPCAEDDVGGLPANAG